MNAIKDRFVNEHLVEPTNGLERLFIWVSRILARVDSSFSARDSGAVATARPAPTRVMVAEDYDLIEVRPNDPPSLAATEVFNVLCLDLDVFSIAEAVNWIQSARRSITGPLPRFVVVGPTRKLSTSEMQHIASAVTPIAVFLSRPVGFATFVEVLKELSAQIRRTSDPGRLQSYSRQPIALSATEAGILSVRR